MILCARNFAIPEMISLIFIMLIVGCNHPNWVKTIRIDSRLRSSYYFKPGTYWVFSDSTAKRYDSLRVSSTVETTIEKVNANSNEQIIINIDQYKLDSNNGYTMDNWVIYLRDSNYLQIVYVTQNVDDNFKIYNYAPLEYPFNNRSYVYYQNPGDTISISTQSSLLVNSLVFHNVKVLNIKNFLFHNGQSYNDTFYFNDQIGWIGIDQLHLNDSIVKHLRIVRYKIIR